MPDTPVRRFLTRMLMTTMLVPAVGGGAQAQLSLNLKRVVNIQPTIEVYLSVACNGQPAYFTDKSFFRLHENGREIGEFQMWFPDPTVRCTMSVALGFAIGTGLSDSVRQTLISAGDSFFQLMDGVNDEAALFWNADSVVRAHAFTTSQNALSTTMAALPSGGRSRVWDVAYAAIRELADSGANPCRGVILLCDTRDSGSSHTLNDVISLSWRQRIRVSVIGLGTEINLDSLKVLATQCGGVLYQTSNPMVLLEIYRALTEIIFQGYQEGVLTYQSPCMDGSLRTVEVSISGFCNGSDSETKTYRAGQDSSTFTPMDVRVTSPPPVRGDTLIDLSVEVRNIFDSLTMHPAIFDLQFDTARLRFVGINLAGSLLDGIPLTANPIPGGWRVQTRAAKTIASSGRLFTLTFRTSTYSGKDTMRTGVMIERWSFSEGCRSVRVEPGTVTIVPMTPAHVLFTVMTRPSLTWNDATLEYAPNPFQVDVLATNTGGEAARGGRVRMTLPDTLLQLVTPMLSVQTLSPPDFAGLANAHWEVFARPRSVGDSAVLCVELTFDNHPALNGCTKIWIPAAGGTTGVGSVSDDRVDRSDPLTAVQVSLHQNIPNPFNPATRIEYMLGAASDVRLTVCDALGRMVRTLVAAHEGAGAHNVVFDAAGLPSGMYLCRLETDAATRTIWMALVR